MTKTADIKWIQKLSTCKTSGDFQAALEGLEADGKAAETRREELKAKRETALLSGKDTTTIVRDLNDATKEVDDIGAAIVAVTRRLDEVLGEEKTAERNEALEGNERDLAAYRKALQRKIAALQSVMEVYSELDRIEKRIEGRNSIIDRTGKNNAESFTAQGNVRTARSEVLRDPKVLSTDIPEGLSVNGRRWAKFWLQLMTSMDVGTPPEVKRAPAFSGAVSQEA